MDLLRHHERRHVEVALTLVVLAIVPYLNSLANPFVYDDTAQVVRNGLVRSLDPWPILSTGSVTHGEVEWYRPLSVYSLAVNYAVSTLRPLSYHAVNVALHAANTLLVWSIARVLLASDLAAFVAAALFATHSVHTEAVTPVFGRADLLAAAFILTGWRLAIGTERGPCVMALLSLSFMGALLSKENAVGLLPLVVVTDLALPPAAGQSFSERARRTMKARWPLWIALVGVLAVWIALRYAATGALTADWRRIRYIENPLIEVGAGERIATALWIVIDYVRLFIYPHPLSVDYSFDQIRPIRGGDARLLVLITVAAGIAAIVAWSRRHPERGVAATDRGRLGLLAALFALLIAPVSNVFFPIGTIMAERLLYLPSAALCMMAALAIHIVYRRATGTGTRMAVLVAVAGILSAAAIATIVRNRDWRSENRLFAAAVEAAPRSVKARFNYGLTLAEAGDGEGARRMIESAVAIAPAYPEAHNTIGTIRMAAGEISAAGREFEAALRDSPEYAPALANLGIVRRREGQLGEARSLLERALAIDPAMAVAHVNLALVAETQGDRATAVRHYRRAYALDPSLDIARRRVETLDPHAPR